MRRAVRADQDARCHRRTRAEDIAVNSLRRNTPTDEPGSHILEKRWWPTEIEIAVAYDTKP